MFLNTFALFKPKIHLSKIISKPLMMKIEVSDHVKDILYLTKLIYLSMILKFRKTVLLMGACLGLGWLSPAYASTSDVAAAAV